MGNLCSSKDNCNQLLGQFAPALIQALVEHSAPLVRDVKLQHAIMGALRNLAVAPEGRGLLLQKGILLPCLDLMAGLSLTPITHPVVMKLLGTTRLLVDSEKEVSLAIAEERLDVLAQIIGKFNDLSKIWKHWILTRKCIFQLKLNFTPKMDVNRPFLSKVTKDCIRGKMLVGAKSNERPMHM